MLQRNWRSLGREYKNGIRKSKKANGKAKAN
jgi:hypothetical protein